jgi:hypothetical protein
MQKLMILYSPTMYCTSYYCMSLNACFCNIRVPDAERERKEGGEVKCGQANIGSHGPWESGRTRHSGDRTPEVWRPCGDLS